MEKLLPVGSVLKLKENPLPIMVVGYYPISKGKKFYRYLGINAAVGLGSDESAIMFNEDSITEIQFRGYSDEKSEQALKNLDELMQKIPAEVLTAAAENITAKEAKQDTVESN